MSLTGNKVEENNVVPKWEYLTRESFFKISQAGGANLGKPPSNFNESVEPSACDESTCSYSRPNEMDGTLAKAATLSLSGISKCEKEDHFSLPFDVSFLTNFNLLTI